MLFTGKGLNALALGVVLLLLLSSPARPVAEKNEPVRPEEATEFSNAPITLAGGAHDYLSVAVSPDGRWAAASGGIWNRLGDVRVWDLRTRREVKVFREMQGVASVTFAPDSRTVYISNAGLRSVTAVDTQAMKVRAVIPVGEVPKRINTLVLR